jgi:hypothetical protein
VSVGVICAVLVGCGAPASTPTSVVEAPRPTPDPAPRPRSGEVSVGGHTINGEWEDGELLGEPLLLEAGVDFADIVYAARGRDATYVATGVRDGDRILRTIVATTPSGTDGIQLYGGDVLGERGPDERLERGRYLLVGTVKGDVTLSVTRPDGRRRPVTGASTSVLPGHTVFYDSGAWDEDWDQVRLAPLVIVTDDGRRAGVRSASWTG